MKSKTSLVRVLCAAVMTGLVTLSTLLCSVQVAAAAVGVEIVNHSMWFDPSSPLTMHIFGEVKNNMDTWLRGVAISAALYDHDNVQLGVVSSSARATFVPPNDVVPFDIVAEGYASMQQDAESGVASYLLTLESLTAMPQSVPTNLAILNITPGKSASGWFEVTGVVENRGDLPSRETRIIGTFYDAGGTVIYVMSAIASPREIPPRGKSDSFKLTVQNDERSSRITRVNLIAESEGYTSIPETPWPGVLAATAVALTVLALRTKRRKLAT